MADPSQPKKETVRIALPRRASNAPNGNGNGSKASDTVRINLPGRTAVLPSPPMPPFAQPTAVPAPALPAKAVASPSAAPIRPPAVPPPPPRASTTPSALSTEAQTAPVAKLPSPPMPPRPRILPPPPRLLPTTPGPSGGVTAAPSIYPGSAVQSSPEKETARISILPALAAVAPPPTTMAKTQPLLTVPSLKAAAAPVITKAAMAAPVSISATGLAAIPMPVVWAAFGISAVTLIIQIWNYFGS